MALIIEDGSIVPGANSYLSVEDFRLYAGARGISLPTEDGDVEPILIKAMDFLESFSDRFEGSRVDRDQPLSWPRSGVVIEDWSWSSTEIPRQVIAAQCALGAEIAGGADPFNPADALPVVRKRVEGAVEVQYANPSQVSKVHKYSASQTIINLLLKNSGLSLIRV